MRAIFAAVAILLVSACSGQSFDRDDAAKLIAETEQASFLGQQISTYQGYLADGEAQGLWSMEDSNVPLVGVAASPQFANLGTDFIEPATPVDIIITVTGMTEIPDNGTTTSAEFDWSYGELPKYIKRFALLGGTGQASFQKFDDGWRLSSVSFSRPDGRAELSSAEMDEINADTAKETARRNAIIERIRTSFSEGDAIKKYNSNATKTKYYYQIERNGISFHEEIVENFSNTGKFNKRYFIWFGHIFNLREDDGNVSFDLHPNENNFILISKFRTHSYFRIDTADFLETAIKAHAEWAKKYGDLPLNLRNKVYYEQHPKRGVH